MTWRDEETMRGLARVRAREVGVAVGVEVVRAGSGLRVVGLDALRGWALVYMLVSHSVIVFAGTSAVSGLGWAVFVVVAGALWRARLGWRWFEITAAGLIAAPAGEAVGLNGFNILLAWSVVLPLVWLLNRVGWESPVVLAVVGITLTWRWPLGGSNPGWVLLVWALGRAHGPVMVGRAGERLPRWGWVMWMARHPLTVYTGHLLVLWGIVRWF